MCVCVCVCAKDLDGKFHKNLKKYLCNPLKGERDAKKDSNHDIFIQLFLSSVFFSFCLVD